MHMLHTVVASALLCPLLAWSAPVSPVDIPHTVRQLDNGLTVIVHEDHKAPIVAVNVWYHVGSKNEAPGRTGFAHLFEHLMFQGSENLKGEYLNTLQELGATAPEEMAGRVETITFSMPRELRVGPDSSGQ